MVWEPEDIDLTLNPWVPGNEERLRHYSDTNLAHRTGSGLVCSDSHVYRDIVEFVENARYNPHKYHDPQSVLMIVDTLVSSGHEYLEHALLRSWQSQYSPSWQLMEFMRDTLDFLETGQRNVPIDAYLLCAIDNRWYRMADGSDDRRKAYQFQTQLGERFERLPKIKNKHNVLEYISMWCKHRGGFKDMVMTLYALSTTNQ